MHNAECELPTSKGEEPALTERRYSPDNRRRITEDETRPARFLPTTGTPARFATDNAENFR